jgi:hypothetical protein
MADEDLNEDLETEIENNEEETSDEGNEEGHEGLQDEEGGGEDEPLRQGEQQEKGQERVLSRASRRFSALANENKALKESQANIRRELDDLRAEQQRRATQPDPMQERLRYEAMSDYEKLQYDFNKGRMEDKAHRQALEARLWEQSDKSDFNTLCVSNEKAAKRAERVEEEFQRLKAQGRPVDRRTIAEVLTGRDVLYSKGATARRAAEGKRNIARQRTTAISPRGEVSGDRRGGKTAAERLEGVTF